MISNYSVNDEDLSEENEDNEESDDADKNNKDVDEIIHVISNMTSYFNLNVKNPAEIRKLAEKSVEFGATMKNVSEIMFMFHEILHKSYILVDR